MRRRLFAKIPLSTLCLAYSHTRTTLSGSLVIQDGRNSTPKAGGRIRGEKKKFCAEKRNRNWPIVDDDDIQSDSYAIQPTRWRSTIWAGEKRLEAIREDEGIRR